MEKSVETEASWGSFLSGCLVLLLIFGGGFALFRHFQARQDSKVADLEKKIFRPYWNAVKEGDFQTAHGLRAESWRTEHSVEELKKAYLKAFEKHGELVKTGIHVANRMSEPGEERQMTRVESIYEFQDGWKGRVIFILVRSGEERPWTIEESRVPAKLSLGDGPY